MKILAAILFLASECRAGLGSYGEAIIPQTEWAVRVENDRAITVVGGPVEITGMCSEVTVKTTDSSKRTLSTCDGGVFKDEPVLEVKDGGMLVVTHKGVEGVQTLEQRFENNEEGGFVVSLGVSGGGVFSSNMIAPIASATMKVKGEWEGKVDAKTILVPWDNDIESMYQSRSLSSAYSNVVGMTSAYLTAFYDETSGRGAVVGALEHTIWKTGISFHAKTLKLEEGEFAVKKLKAFGGLNGLKETRDYVEHGWVKSSEEGELVSPKFMVGVGEDWRDEMEAYGRSQVEKGLELPGGMKGPVVGWNSWGVQQFPATLQNGVDASEAVKTLKEGGFVGEDGGWGGDAFIDFDAVNIGLDEQVKLVETTEKNGQSAGFYLAPWSLFSDDLTGTTECGGKTWNVVDLVKKNGKGEPLKVLDKRVLGQANYAFDPTHEAVLCKAMSNIDKALEAGMKLVKIDFINWGAMEGGSGSNGEHYVEGIETGVAAYNYGMEKIAERVGGKMIISLSMAPTFPNHFAHARRIGCDQMYGGVEFTMNQLWGGWWQKEMLLLDPDLMVFVKDYIFDIPNFLKPFVNPWKMDEMSRVNKGVVHGGFYLAGDDLSNSTGVEAVQKWFGRKEVNEVVKLGEAFRPVGSPADGVHVRAPEVFELKSKTGDQFLAIFNYNYKEKNGYKVGVEGGEGEWLDLWTGERIEVKDGVLKVDVKAASSRLFKRA